MGSDESHFNVSLVVRDRVTKQCPETTIFEEKGEPKQIQKGSNERLNILTRTHSMHNFGEIPFIKPENYT